MPSGRIMNLLAQHRTAVVFTIIGVIASPIVGVVVTDYISITPKRLAGLLENDKVSVYELALNITKDSKSKVKVSECNELRKHLKQPITFENPDLSDKTLTRVNLDSVIILHSNLSNANLEKSTLDNVQISGDLSGINLRNASLYNADLRNSNLSNAVLEDAYVSDADLTDTLFSDADLTNANFSYAVLANADLRHANLTNANLVDTDLQDRF